MCPTGKKKYITGKMSDEEVCCPKCGSKDKHVLYAGMDGQKYYICKECGRKYFTPEEE
jgi:transposase-like protein